MLFNSKLFVVFFAVVFALHFATFFSHRQKKINLLIASYVFYAAWNPPFILLIWISTVIDWYACRCIYEAPTQRARRGYLALSLVTNLGLLGFFKYGNFLLENFIQVAGAMGIDYQPAPMSIILPVGISFYTFQTMSYTLDVFFGRGKPWPSFLDYALYVTFFPQLVAGPIVRASQFLPQCLKPTKYDATRVWEGLSLFTLGLFQKVVIADFLMAPIVEKVYAPGAAPTSVEAWAGTAAFSIQIFCDFAGYSTCAIGVGRCLGFRLPQNFWFPYAAIGFSDFWHRWHITLSAWLRDYLYIPLGGNRIGPTRTCVNLMMTMLLGGLWHGAAWTFICWGGLHGLYLVLERGARKLLGGNALWKHAPVRLGLGVLTYLLVCLTWVMFRSSSFDQAYDLSVTMLAPTLGDGVLRHLTSADLLVVTVVVLTTLLLQARLRSTPVGEVALRTPWWLTAILFTLLMIVVLATAGDGRAFIYFQF